MKKCVPQGTKVSASGIKEILGFISVDTFNERTHPTCFPTQGSGSATPSGVPTTQVGSPALSGGDHSWPNWKSCQSLSFYDVVTVVSVIKIRDFSTKL